MWCIDCRTLSVEYQLRVQGITHLLRDDCAESMRVLSNPPDQFGRLVDLSRPSVGGFGLNADAPSP